MGYIYLLEDRANNIIKIGKTVDLKGRKGDYRTHHPAAEWIVDYEVDSCFLVEQRLLVLVRQKWNQVVGTREWFYGTMQAEELREFIDQVLSTTSLDDDYIDLPNEIVSSRIDQFFMGIGLPISGIVWDAHHGDGDEWVEFVNLKVYLSTGGIDGYLTGIHVSVDGMVSALMLMLCAPDNMNLLQLLERLPPSNISPCWHTVSGSVAKATEWMFEGLREIDIITLITEEIRLGRPVNMA